MSWQPGWSQVVGDAGSAADILDHSMPATTLAIYSHAISSAKAAAVATIDSGWRTR
jgi:hypothetical protein